MAACRRATCGSTTSWSAGSPSAARDRARWSVRFAAELAELRIQGAEPDAERARRFALGGATAYVRQDDAALDVGERRGQRNAQLVGGGLGAGRDPRRRRPGLDRQQGGHVEPFGVDGL